MQIDKCFGFDTAVDQAQEALLAAKVEASSALRGVGVVKLMGRSSGFIAMQASLASGAGSRNAEAHLLNLLPQSRSRQTFVGNLSEPCGHPSLASALCCQSFGWPMAPTSYRARSFQRGVSLPLCGWATRELQRLMLQVPADLLRHFS